MTLRSALRLLALAACVVTAACGPATHAVTSEPVPPSTLSPRQLEGIVALTRAVAAIRYRHPADQAATLDWNAFLPVAMDRILAAADRSELREALRTLFSQVAPSVEFSAAPASSLAEPPHQPGDRLVRWRYAGLGPDGGFKSWREGRDDDQANIVMAVPVALPDPARCGKARLRGRLAEIGNEGKVLIFAKVDQAGDALQSFERTVTSADLAPTLDFEMPADAYQVRLGIELQGHALATLESLSLSCSRGDGVHVDLQRASWQRQGFPDLYLYPSDACRAAPCLKVVRRPLEGAFVARRDVLDVQIADRLWVHVPLAVWSDGTRTLPETAPWAPPSSGASGSGARLATIASAWATLAVFYPNFRDQGIDWPRVLPRALTEAAAAQTTADLFHALSRLMAKLHDLHARAIHSSFPIDGVLPVMLRRFGDRLVVVGGLPAYRTQLPIGSEITAIDEVPALRAYAEMSELVSSSTPGAAGWKIPHWLTLGPVGAISTLRAKMADGRERAVPLPHVSRADHDYAVREPRPAFGAEVAPGVYYIDLEDMKAAQWEAALPSLRKARAIVLDMRGYPGIAVFAMVGHFIDVPVRSPIWQTPTLEANDQTSYWEICPKAPRLHAKLVVLVDGRAASAAETFLQIVQDNHLAMLVGETSAGTNGTPNVVALPGGFSMRFTGERALRADGTGLQGRGITPDVTVHPTLEGVRAGRDEVLQAGIARASR